MIPFSVEVYFAVLAAYNEAVWPLHIVALGMAGLALMIARRPAAGFGWVPGAVLTAAWSWTAIAYFYLQFARIDFWSYGAAAVFMLQAILLAWAGLVRGPLALAFDRNAAGWVAGVVGGLGLVGYPLLGWALRGSLGEAGWFGLTPAPTVLFTLGLMAGLRGGAPLYLLILPVVWCLWQSLFAYQLMIVEDFVLVPAAIATVAACLRSRRVEVD